MCLLGFCSFSPERLYEVSNCFTAVSKQRLDSSSTIINFPNIANKNIFKNSALCDHMWPFDCSNFFLCWKTPSSLFAMKIAKWLRVWLIFTKILKETREQACQLIIVPALFYQNNVFEPWKDFRTKNGVA